MRWCGFYRRTTNSRCLGGRRSVAGRRDAPPTPRGPACCLRLFAQKPFHDGDESRFLQSARVLRKRRIGGAQVIPGVLERQLLDARERSHQGKPQRVSERRVEVIARMGAHRMLFLFLRRASISHTGPAMPRSGTMESMMKSCVRDTGVKVVVSMSAK